MTKLSRFMARPLADKLLFFRAAVLLAVCRIGLAVVPLPMMRRVLAVLAWCPMRRRRRGVTAREVSWAVATASRLVPGADTCLYRAFAAEAILRGVGAPAELMFGFGRSEAGDVRGHAWIESEGLVVTGAEEFERYETVMRVAPNTRGEAKAGSTLLAGRG